MPLDITLWGFRFITFHVSAFLFAACGAVLTIILREFPTLRMLWGNPLHDWVFGITVLGTVSYVANVVQEILLSLASFLLAGSSWTSVFFAVRACLSSLSTLTTVIVGTSHWTTALEFSDDGQTRMSQFWDTLLIVAIADIFRKIYLQRAVVRFNTSQYRSRLATYKFRTAVMRLMDSLSKEDQGRGSMEFKSPVAPSATHEQLVPEPVSIPLDDTTPFGRLMAQFLSGQWDRSLHFESVTRAGIRRTPRKKRSPLQRYAEEFRTRVFGMLSQEGRHLAPMDLARIMDEETAGNTMDWLGNGDHNNPLIVPESFDPAICSLLIEHVNLAKSLDSVENFSRVIKSLVNTVFWVMMAIVTLFVFDYSLERMLLTFGTLIATIAFAFGSSITKFVESMVFLLANRPCDVGDRIQIGDHDAGMRYWVESITPMQTTLRSSYNKHCIYPNSALASTPIYNLSRGSNAVLLINLQISNQTKPHQLRAMAAAVSSLIEGRPQDWTPGIFWAVDELENSNMYRMYYWLTTRYKHENLGAILEARSAMILHIQAALDELGVRWYPAVQTVRLLQPGEDPFPGKSPLMRPSPLMKPTHLDPH